MNTQDTRHTPVTYINQWGIEVVGFESAMGGLYKSELVAQEVSDGVGPCHAVVRFVDVFDAYEALEHILKFDAKSLGAIGESLVRSALRNSTRPTKDEFKWKQDTRDEAKEVIAMCLAAMERMGNVLNNMDAVEPEDEVAVTPAFNAARQFLAQPPKATDNELQAAYASGRADQAEASSELVSELAEKCEVAAQVYAHLKMWPLLDEVRIVLAKVKP